jgi:hypothetical protein
VWLAACVHRRLVVVGLSVAVVVLAGLLVHARQAHVVVEQKIGPTRCTYDDHRHRVDLTVPLSVATHGEVSLEVQAQVRDRRDPGRMPYVSTRTVTVDTDGHATRRDVTLHIAMPRSEWLAGHDDCGISVRTVRSR